MLSNTLYFLQNDGGSLQRALSVSWSRELLCGIKSLSSSVGLEEKGIH